MKNIIIFACLILAININAQKKVDIDSAIVHLLAPLDLTEVTSNMLLERGFPFPELKKFNGTIRYK